MHPRAKAGRLSADSALLRMQIPVDLPALSTPRASPGRGGKLKWWILAQTAPNSVLATEGLTYCKILSFCFYPAQVRQDGTSSIYTALIVRCFMNINPLPHWKLSGIPKGDWETGKRALL